MWFRSRSPSPGRNVDFHGTLAKFGVKLAERAIPDFFSIACTADAWYVVFHRYAPAYPPRTYLVPKDIGDYLFARFKPFEESELKKKPVRVTKQGNQTSLNAGFAWDDGRRVFPDSKEKAAVDAMLKKGYTQSVHTGFIELVVDTKFKTAKGVMGEENAKKLKTQIEWANKINKGIEGEAKKLKAAKTKAERTKAKDKQQYSRFVPSPGSKNDLPKTLDEWRVCTVYNKAGKVLSFAAFEDNAYISFSKRKRPDTKVCNCNVQFLLTHRI